jgi:hypothetical protein
MRPLGHTPTTSSLMAISRHSLVLLIRLHHSIPRVRASTSQDILYWPHISFKIRVIQLTSQQPAMAGWIACGAIE